MKTRFELNKMTLRSLLKFKSKLLNRRFRILYETGLFDSPTRQELTRVREVIYEKTNDPKKLRHT